MHSSSTGEVRFLHPQEAGLLNSIPVSFRYPADARHGLALVGQLAAPLQALWVVLHLQVAADHAFLGHSDIIPLQQLRAFQDALLEQRQDCWEVLSTHSCDSLCLQQDGVTCQVKVSPPIQVRQLTAAQVALFGPGWKAEVWADGRLLPAHALLHGGENGPCYELRMCSKLQAKSCHQASAVVWFLKQDGIEPCVVPIGTALDAVAATVSVPLEHAVDAVDGGVLEVKRGVTCNRFVDARARFWAEASIAFCTDTALDWAIQVLQPEVEVLLLRPTHAGLLFRLFEAGCITSVPGLFPGCPVAMSGVLQVADHWIGWCFRRLPSGEVAGDVWNCFSHEQVAVLEGFLRGMAEHWGR